MGSAPGVLLQRSPKRVGRPIHRRSARSAATGHPLWDCPVCRRSARARDLAPARLGPSVSRSASSVTLPQLDWSRPSRARTSARTRCAHPGKANTASANRGSAPSVLGTDIAGTPYPRVPSRLGLPWSRTLTWRHCCTLRRPPLAAACPRRNGTVAACRSRQRGTIVQLANSSQVSFPNIPSHTRHFRSLSRGDKDACPHRRRKPSVPCRVRLPKPGSFPVSPSNFVVYIEGRRATCSSTSTPFPGSPA